jgi:hypothetical protein
MYNSIAYAVLQNIADIYDCKLSFLERGQRD